MSSVAQRPAELIKLATVDSSHINDQFSKPTWMMEVGPLPGKLLVLLALIIC